MAGKMRAHDLFEATAVWKKFEWRSRAHTAHSAPCPAIATQVKGVLHVEEGSGDIAEQAAKVQQLGNWVGKVGKIRDRMGRKVEAMDWNA